MHRLKRKFFWNRRVSHQDVRNLEDSLLDESVLNQDYIVLILGSCAIATFGLLSNSAAVIIGAMLIAPLVLPIRGVAFGALEGNIKLLQEGMKALLLGTFIAILLAFGIGWLVGLPQYGSEVMARSRPNLLDLGIAVVAGSISGFAKIEPRLSNSLAGAAIAVALMPPICVIGLGLAQGDLVLSKGASLLYLTNLLGITLSCMLIFLIAGYTPLGRAQGALSITLVCVGLLGVPLGISLTELVRQNRLEASLKEALLNRTITFQRVQWIDSETDWLASPPEVRLTVYAQEPVTPKQVRLLEEFVAREMGRPFTLIFQVSPIQEVIRENPNVLPTKTLP